jgi:hypothetical protein
MRFVAYQDPQGNMHIVSQGDGARVLGYTVPLDYETYLKMREEPHLYTIDKKTDTIKLKHKGKEDEGAE